jgi:UDP-N-acetylmuramate--alanine ligase
LCNDRAIQSDLMAALGLARTAAYTLTRQEWLAAKAADLYQEASSQVGFPMAIYPNQQSGGGGASILEEKDGLEGFELAVNRALFREVLPVIEWKDRSAFERREYVQLLTDLEYGPGFPLELSFRGQTQTLSHPAQLLRLLDGYAAQADAEEVFELESAQKGDKVIIEPQLMGRSFACVVLRKEDGLAVALPPSEIIADGLAPALPSVLAAEQHAPAPPIELPEEQLEAIRRQSARLFDEIGFQAYARIDGLVRPDGAILFQAAKPSLPLYEGAFAYRQAAAIGLSPTQFLTYLLAISLRERLATAASNEHYARLLNQLESKVQAARAAFSHHKRIGLLCGGFAEGRQRSLESGRYAFEKLDSLGKYELLPLYLSGTPDHPELFQLPPASLLETSCQTIEQAIRQPAPAAAVLSAIRAQCADIAAKYAPAHTLAAPRPLSFADLPQMLDAVLISLSSEDAKRANILGELTARRIPYNGPSATALRVCNSRYETLQALQRNGFKTPKQVLLPKHDYTADPEMFFRRVESQLHYPIVGKPAEGPEREGCRMLRARNELEAYTRLLFRPNDEEGLEARRILQLKSREAFPRQSLALFESPVPAKNALYFMPIVAGLLSRPIAEDHCAYEFFPPTEAPSPSGAFTPEGEIAAAGAQPHHPAMLGGSPERHRLAWTALEQQLDKIARILDLRSHAAIHALARVYEDGSAEVIPIEVEALPSLAAGSSLYAQAALSGLTPHQIIDNIIRPLVEPPPQARQPESAPAAAPGAGSPPQKSAARQEPIVQHQPSMEKKGSGFRPQPFGQYFLQRSKELASEAWAFLKSPIFLRNFAGLLGAILLFYLLTVWILKVYTRHGESIQVPDFIGMDMDDALDKARKQRFKIIAIDSFFDSSRDPNTIFQQDPRPLQRAKQGRTIYVSKYRITPDSVILPSLMSAGYNYNQYAIKLKRLDVQAVVKERIFDSKQAENSILHFYHRERKITDEMLRSGVKVPKGALLEFVVTERLSSDVPIPDLICKRYDAAVFLLSSSNLSIGNIYGDVADRQQAYVYRQEPEYMPGQMIPQGQQISIYLTLAKPAGCPDDPEDSFVPEPAPGVEDDEF